MKCVLCRDSLMEDAAIYELNPNTNRYATMHPDCWQVAYDDLAESEKDVFQERKAAR